MSEQEPKPPNPNELISPPPVVNPPSSRSDKNLKTKKTTRSMNPKPANTMKHHDMLSKSTDVNFKKVMTRSSSKGSESSSCVEDMEFVEETGNGDTGKDGAGNDVNGAVEMSDVVSEGDVAKENVADKGRGQGEGVFGNETNGNLSAMFPELNSANVNVGSSDKLPEMPVPFDNNPVLNPTCTKHVGNENKSTSNVSSGDENKSASNVSSGNTGMQVMKDTRGVVDEASGSKDVEMKETNKTRKPMLFSNVVQGANYVGGNKLRMVPCAVNEGTPLIMGKVTTEMCEKGYGRASYARVLVEVEAAKGLVDSVEIWYRSLNRSMKLKVEYAWSPPICSHCCVFGHSFEGCTNRELSDKEKSLKNDTKVQTANKVNEVQVGDEGWQQVNYGGGMYMSRGGPGFRGRGGFTGRGGNNGYQAYNEKKNYQAKNNVKGKDVVVENVQNQEKKQEADKTKENNVKYIAQRNFISKNKFDVLARGEVDDNVNEWQGVKVNIDVACEMGIPFDEDEMSKWPNDLQNYYKDKCAAMKNSDKRDLLLNKVRMLVGDINSSRTNIEQNCHKKANEGVAFEMESSGVSREQAFGVGVNV
ncbi:ATPase, F1/V1/A1 complex, alpha/beta subunit, Zinc knuckle CX2CX4HX4C [Artemisia annua]|uniref:ATPase, F1/V1/A1 complex, alpha/beta subunit, Zinc knuckle CX2CX4HX4C n=1 Tax=Artemisia annua TaxID=35608 RepID=A0A2U1Q6R1_ARTAN|nr:ATPase, F1/V1/A1 complex, alpha/beta subunit, Zinc knuckle CX2CX4HX4C [Artemisia annua]